MLTAERNRVFERWIDAHKAILFKVARVYGATHSDREDLFQVGPERSPPVEVLVRGKLRPDVLAVRALAVGQHPITRPWPPRA